jgi:hypothetical protein
MTKFLASLKGYRTIIVNAVFALVGVFIALGILPASEAMGVTQEVIANNVDALIGGLGVVAAVVNVALRFVTNTPVRKKS